MCFSGTCNSCPSGILLGMFYIETWLFWTMHRDLRCSTEHQSKLKVCQKGPKSFWCPPCLYQRGYVQVPHPLHFHGPTDLLTVCKIAFAEPIWGAEDLVPPLSTRTRDPPPPDCPSRLAIWPGKDLNHLPDYQIGRRRRHQRPMGTPIWGGGVSVAHVTPTSTWNVQNVSFRFRSG